jgi:hypothetical protein
MRGTLLSKFTISNLMHMENNVMGIAFGTAVTILWNNYLPDFKGTYHQIKTNDVSKKIPEKLPIRGNRYNCPKQTNFRKIPGSPIAYWVSKHLIDSFKNNLLNNYLITREGMTTGDNKKFLKLWYEISFNRITFNIKSYDKALWVPYNKGGKYKKWKVYENYVVNWEDNGFKIKNNSNSRNGKIRSHNYNGKFGLKTGITWSSLSSGKISFRYTPKGYLFDSKGAMGFLRGKFYINDLYQILGFLNSKVASKYLEIFSPTLDYKVGDIILLPIVKNKNNESTINAIVKENIKIVKDYDLQFEYFWNFKHHPFLNHIAEHNRFPPPLKAGLKKFLIYNCAKNVPKHSKTEVKNGKLS